MEDRAAILIVSDIHYASDLEKERVDYECAVIQNPFLRGLIRFYRYFIWLRDPFAHNHLLERVLNPPFAPDLVVANGDYSCDSAFIGVADPASKKSALECLGQLRARYSPNLRATFGDHELGKISMVGNCGGLRLQSWTVSREELALEPFWTHRIGKYVLMGITSSLVALPVYQKEALPDEVEQWRDLRAEHIAQINAAFENLASDDRVILFSHDPTALPFLYQERPVWGRLDQIERTILGHLHTRLLIWQSRMLAGIPPIRGFGAAIARMSSALHQAKKWKPFNVLLCPSLAGIELFQRGGFYEMRLDPTGQRPADFQLHVVDRS